MNKDYSNLIVIVALVIIVTIIASPYGDRDRSNSLAPNQPEVSVEVRQAVDQFKKTLTTKHQYKNGRHTFLGKFEVPNACYNYELTVDDANNTNDERIIKIDYIEPEVKNCPSTESVEKRFVSSFDGPADLDVRAQINGQEANLNIIEVPPNRDIAKF